MEKEIVRPILSFFLVRGREQYRWRDPKTGRFVKGVMWRTTISLKKFPIHNEYYGAILQSFTAYQLDDFDVNVLMDKFLELLEDFVGYSESDFWFDVKPLEKEVNVALMRDKECFGKWIWQVEHLGYIVEKKEGDANELFS